MKYPKATKEPLCFFCKHLTDYPYCEAFPDGIPKVIRDGTNPHIKPTKGDHGIVYEKITTLADFK
jgi:hypothetical protein